MPADQKVPANFGTVLIGIVAGVSCILGPKMIKMFGRRKLTTIGHLWISVVLMLLTVTIVTERGYLSIFFMCCITATCMGILGACMHIYVPEICNDT